MPTARFNQSKPGDLPVSSTYDGHARQVTREHLIDDWERV